MTGFMNLMGQIAYAAIGELLFTNAVVALIVLHTVGEDGEQLCGVQSDS